MKITIDKFWRIVIPKELRQRFGLIPGHVLEINVSDDAIILRSAEGQSPLTLEDGLLVFNGAPIGDLAGWVRGERARISKRFHASV